MRSLSEWPWAVWFVVSMVALVFALPLTDLIGAYAVQEP